MAFDTIQVPINAELKTNGSVSVAYPTGRSASDYDASGNHVLEALGFSYVNPVYIEVAFGGSLITIDYFGSTTIPRGTLAIGQFALIEASDFATAAQGALADTALQAADVDEFVQIGEHNLAASAAPTVDDDAGDTTPRAATNLWFDLTGSKSTSALMPRKARQIGQALIQKGALATLDTVPGNRQYAGVPLEKSVASGNAELDEGTDGTIPLYVIVNGDQSTTPRTIKLYEPAADVPSRALWLINDTDGTGALTVIDHADAAVSGGTTLTLNTARLVQWAGGEWLDTGIEIPYGASSGAGITAQTDTVSVAVDDLTTLVEATHSNRNLNGTDDERRSILLRNGTDQGDPVDVLIPSGFADNVQWDVAFDQTGPVKFSVTRTLGYDNQSASFDVGETLTAPGGFSGRVLSQTATSAIILDWNGTDPIEDEQLTGGTSGSTADVDATLLAGTDTINSTLSTIEVGVGGGGSPAGASGSIRRLSSGGYSVDGDTAEPAVVSSLEVVDDATVGGDLAVIGTADFAGGAVTGNVVVSNSAEIYGQLSPWQTMTGSQAGAPSGRAWKITGNATAIPVTDGWWAKVLNISGGDKTIAGASGSIITTADATTGTTLTIGDDKMCFLHSDGTNIYADGDVTVA